MKVELARPSHETAIKGLLAECNLPNEDITAQHIKDYLTLWDDQALLGVVGLEVYGDQALLRSLAIRSHGRGRGHAARLVEEIEVYARERKVKTLFLLTTTAEGFFWRRGYVKMDRKDAPAEIAATAEFQSLCPDSAVCMMKEVD